MKLNEQDWRPITFQGVTFPATLMGIDILMHLADEHFGEESELGEWLWRLPICRGVTKSAPAEKCARCAQQAIELMLEHRQRVIDGIRERLAPHGFDAESTYSDWILALQRIVETSTSTDGDCSWSAPLHKKDPIQNAQDAKRLLRNLERCRNKLLEEERNKQKPGNDPAAGESS
jgi:hypothetical protein